MSVSKHSFSIFSRDIFLTFANLVNGILITRFLGPEFFGYWMILILIPTYIEAFGRTKIDIAAVFFISKDQSNQYSILNTLNSFGLLFSIIILLLILLFFNSLYDLIFNDLNYDLKSFTLLILLQVPAQVLYLNYSYYFLAIEKIRTYNLMVIVKALTYTLLLIIFFILDFGLFGVVLSFIISTFLGFLYGFFLSDINKFRIIFNYNDFIKLFSYAINFYISGLLSHFNEFGSRTIAVFLVSPVYVGFFGLSQSLVKIINRVNDAINQILYSRISKLKKKSATNLALKSFRIAFVILFISCLIFMIFIDLLITVMYGTDYFDSIL